MRRELLLGHVAHRVEPSLLVPGSALGSARVGKQVSDERGGLVGHFVEQRYHRDAPHAGVRSEGRLEVGQPYLEATDLDRRADAPKDHEGVVRQQARKVTRTVRKRLQWRRACACGRRRQHPLDAPRGRHLRCRLRVGSGEVPTDLVRVDARERAHRRRHWLEFLGREGGCTDVRCVEHRRRGPQLADEALGHRLKRRWVQYRAAHARDDCANRRALGGGGSARQQAERHVRAFPSGIVVHEREVGHRESDAPWEGRGHYLAAQHPHVDLREGCGQVARARASLGRRLDDRGQQRGRRQQACGTMLR